ncbi:MAG: hypothetical protein ACRDMH_01120 [Solirubrobacterales bacterium]
MWAHSGYSGAERDLDGSLGGTGWHNFVNTSKWSAKNRFGNRCLQLSYFIGGGGPGVVTLNPDEEDPSSGGGGWESFKITNYGTLCA